MRARSCVQKSSALSAPSCVLVNNPLVFPLLPGCRVVCRQLLGDNPGSAVSRTMLANRRLGFSAKKWPPVGVAPDRDRCPTAVVRRDREHLLSPAVGPRSACAGDVCRRGATGLSRVPVRDRPQGRTRSSDSSSPAGIGRLVAMLLLVDSRLRRPTASRLSRVAMCSASQPIVRSRCAG